MAVRKAKASVVNIVGYKILTEGMVPVYEPIKGTGFIYSKDGLIISNSHVVQDEAEYSVILLDGQEYPAKVLGMDKFRDVALLKIEAMGLTPAQLGNSDNLETGQTVFAIGNSLGKYQHAVTRGVVSGLGRTVGIGTPKDPKPRFQNLINRCRHKSWKFRGSVNKFGRRGGWH